MGVAEILYVPPDFSNFRAAVHARQSVLSGRIMGIGIAAVIIFILYLIDKNKQWRAAGKIGAALGLAALTVAGVVTFENYRNREAEKSEAMKRVAASAAADAARERVRATERKACEDLGGVYQAGRYPESTCTPK